MAWHDVTQAAAALADKAAQTVNQWAGNLPATGQVAGKVAEQAAGVAAAASAAAGVAATAAVNAASGASAAVASAAAGAAQATGMAQWDMGHLAAMAAALGWASGVRLYLVVFITGAAGFMGWVPLPPGLQLLSNPVVMAASFLMLAVEFLADKVPGVDTVWDTIHTFIRIPAGAALAFGALSGATGADSQVWALVAALAGGTLAATSHAAKTTTRAAANTSPEPFSNIALSLLGDAAVPAVLWLAYEHPSWFWPVLAVLVVMAVVVVVVLFKFLRAVFRRFAGLRPAMT